MREPEPSTPERSTAVLPSGDAMMTDVASAQTGDDAEAFRRIFEAEFDDLSRFVQRRAEQAVVDDVVAETFLVAWRRFAELPSEPDQVRPWLFAVARRTLANAHRGRRRARNLTDLIATQPRHEEHDDAAAVAHRVDFARAFEKLSSRDREVLALVAWDGLTAAQAARVLDISTSAFSVRLSRARRRLRGHLESHHVEGASS